MVVWAARCRLLFWASLYLAPSVASAAERASTESGPGDTAWALPGIVRVGVPATSVRRLAVAGTAGYGYTEAQSADDGAHHRLMGSAAVGFAPLRSLELALRFDGRHDRHPDDGNGAYGGSVGDPRLLARFGGPVGTDLLVGAELGAWAPGKDAPSVVLDATTLDLALLGAWAPANGPVLAFRGGFRLDGSANAAPDPDRLRSGDRLALGLSDSNALLVGAGVSVPVGATEILGEVSWDLLVGSKAPAALESPLRLTAGARHALSKTFGLEFTAEVSPSARPSLGPNDPLVPIEPRVSLLAGLRFRLPFESAEPVGAGDVALPSEKQPPADAAKIKAKTVIRVAGAGGEAVPVAQVTVRVGEWAKEGSVAPGGTLELEDVPAGEGTVAVVAEGFANAEQPARFGPGEPAEVVVKLTAVAPSGQLRGLVRSFAGKGIAASIRVEPIGSEVKSDAAGAFTLDVPPGEYEVVITAPGFKEQRRKVKVDVNGVTVLNAELFEAKR